MALNAFFYVPDLRQKGHIVYRGRKICPSNKSGLQNGGGTMFSKEEVKELLDELLEEEALLVGGIVALHPIRDELIWKLMKGLDQIRNRFIAKVEDAPEDPAIADNQLNLTPHPAIEHFLLKLKRSSGNKGAML
jgi:hypothetical protein